jgi:hypothetical protein
MVPEDVPESRLPAAAELELIREVIDPEGAREREVSRLGLTPTRRHAKDRNLYSRWGFDRGEGHDRVSSPP